MTQIVRRHLICLSPSGRPCAANFIPTTHAVHRRKVGPTASNSALQPRSKARSRVLLRVCQPPRIIRNGTCRCKPASASRTNSAALEVSWQRAARDQRPPTPRTGSLAASRFHGEKRSPTPCRVIFESRWVGDAVESLAPGAALCGPHRPRPRRRVKSSAVLVQGQRTRFTSKDSPGANATRRTVMPSLRSQ